MKTRYVKTALTGGTASALDGILITTPLLTDDFAFVVVGNVATMYNFDATSAAAESIPDIINPDGNTGNGRWILQNLKSTGFTGTSVTSNAVGTGAKTFTIETNKAFVIGMSVKIADSAAPGTNWMHGDITAYTASTGVLVVNVTLIGGSGTKTAWTVSLSAPASTSVVYTFSRGGTLLNAVDGITAVNVFAGRLPVACTVTAVKGWRVGGTGATINARLNGASNHLASALSLVNASTVYDGGAVQNTAYSIGDYLEIMVVSVAGTVSQIGIQVDFETA
jgi:hypothetical protein